MATYSPGARRILLERETGHFEREGYTVETDRVDNSGEELAFAAISYALPHKTRHYPFVLGQLPTFWPWDPRLWKPTPDDRIRELVKAGALIAAEIDRRLAEKEAAQ